MSVLSDLVEVEKSVVDAAKNAAEAGVSIVADALHSAAELVREVIDKVGGEE